MLKLVKLKRVTTPPPLQVTTHTQANMLPSDHDLASLCLSSETDALGFDFIDDGAETGVWFGIKKLQDYDVVCFRGSITFEDWMGDSHAEMISMPGIGQVHTGFSNNMLFVKAKLSTLVRPNPVVTGHSLGAARAAIYAGLLSQQLHNEPVRTVIFGCPRPGAQALVTACENLNMVSYRNRRDPVTDVPFEFPEFPYVPIRPFIQVDGMVDTSLPPPFDDHHIINYLKGIENAKFKTG